MLWTIGNLKNKVPFVTSPNAILKSIEKVIKIDDTSVVYDLGCGDGRVLFYLSNLKPKAKYVGIENNLFPLFLAKISLFFKKKNENKIEIKKGNFFNQNLSEATHVFTYLYPSVIDELLPKLEKELKPGTRFISLSFKFTNKKPIEELDLGRGKYKLGRKLYIYQF
ncbi:MAG: class I SAM-dependent methyltransferase [Candidatus Pacebacteria bacterium]|nr:class I SAM-dependent methyltransferase [Candidatus Paceibacterota bacterium]